MIVTSQVHHCRECGSAHIVRSGRNRYGSQQYLCRECGASKVLLPKQRHSEERKAEVLRSLPGALLAAGTQPHLRDHAQDDPAVAKKTPEPARRGGNPVRGQG